MYGRTAWGYNLLPQREPDGEHSGAPQPSPRNEHNEADVGD